MYKLILMDLDGTLLRSDKTISNYTLSVIEKCKAVEMLIGISTARGESNAQKFLTAVRPDVVISSGGALIRYKGKPLCTNGFSAEETCLLIRAAQELTNAQCEITVDTLDKYYWNYKVDPQAYDASWGATVYTDYTDFRELSLKICVELSDESLARQIAARVDGCDCVRFSGSDWYKFSSRLATKEMAIEELRAKLSISEADILAFGDDLADIGMLRVCGKGVAMGNAVPAVKAIADDVTESNDEDGVARYLERVIL